MRGADTMFFPPKTPSANMLAWDRFFMYKLGSSRQTEPVGYTVDPEERGFERCVSTDRQTFSITALQYCTVCD